MSEDASSRCPACTAVLLPGTVECPWCGHLMTPKAEESLAEVVIDALAAEEEPAPTSAEPARDEQTEKPVYLTQEPGLSELPPASSRARHQPESAGGRIGGVFPACFGLLFLPGREWKITAGRACPAGFWNDDRSDFRGGRSEAVNRSYA